MVKAKNVKMAAINDQHLIKLSELKVFPAI